MTEDAQAHVHSLGLLQCEAEDTFALHQMFVNRMLEPDEELREFIGTSFFSTMNWEIL